MKQIPLRKVSPKQAKELARRRKLKAELIEKTEGVCERCGQQPDWRGLSLHHLKLLSQGGKTEIGNAVLVCSPCHSYYHNLREV